MNILTKLDQSFPEDLVACHRSIQMFKHRQIRHKRCSDEATETAEALNNDNIGHNNYRKIFTTTKQQSNDPLSRTTLVSRHQNSQKH